MGNKQNVILNHKITESLVCKCTTISGTEVIGYIVNHNGEIRVMVYDGEHTDSYLVDLECNIDKCVGRFMQVQYFEGEVFEFVYDYSDCVVFNKHSTITRFGMFEYNNFSKMFEIIILGERTSIKYDDIKVNILGKVSKEEYNLKIEQ